MTPITLFFSKQRSWAEQRLLIILCSRRKDRTPLLICSEANNFTDILSLETAPHLGRFKLALSLERGGASSILQR
jgi:hypothetical protein